MILFMALRRPANVLILAILVAAAAGMMLTAPVAGDFWWPDAPQHALNGVFMMDLIHDHPFHGATQWAMNYYIHYPALTILFYPPLFYLIESGFFAIFGVSHAVAQLTVTFFILLLAIGVYIFSRQWLPKMAALGVALLTIGAPEVAYWDRQVMLEIPAYSLGLLSMLAICAYIRLNAPKYLYLAVLFFLAALYTKYQIAFLVVPAAAAVLTAKGWRGLLDRHVQIALISGFVLALPAAYMVFRFGRTNVAATVGVAGDVGINSVQAWTTYAGFMPEQLGWPVITLAIMGGVGFAFFRGSNRPVESWAFWMLVTWFVIGYLFFSVISLREPRHDLAVLFPIILLAAFTVITLFGRGLVGQSVILALGAATYVYSLLWCAPPVVTGYREIAAYVADNTPEGGVMVFYGYRDSNFVFDLREHSKRDLSVLRATKMLAAIRGERRRGVIENDVDEAGINQILKDDGVSMIVAQREFWPDIQTFRRFEKLMKTSDYQLVKTFQATGDMWAYNDSTGTLDVFVPTYKVEPPKGPIVIDLPVIGEKVTGLLGK